MKRVIALTTAALLGMPSTLFALGLGTIETTSGLNQPFEARIELLGPTADELSTLQVSLADAEAFQRAGVDRPFFLTMLKFEVIDPPRGRSYVRVSSREPIREPFLNFLLEVNWAKGRLFREYTVLLDPPIYDPGQRRVVQPSSPPPAGPPPAERPPTVYHDQPPPGGSPPSTAPSPSPALESQPAPRTYGYDGRETVRGDTLWAIAQSVRPGGVSIQQTMLALLRANPEAFFLDGNINALKTGYVLQIPDRDEILSLNSSEAIAQVARHNSLWEEYKQRVAGGVSPRPEGADVSTGEYASEDGGAPDAGQDSEVLDAPAGAADEPTVTYADEPEGRLELVSPSEDGSEGTVEDFDAAGREQLEDDIALLSEQLDAREQENRDLLDRLEEAETIIDELRRLVALRDDQLAALQDTVGEAAPAEDAVLEEPTDVIGEPGDATAEAGDEFDEFADELAPAEAPLEDTDSGLAADDGLTADTMTDEEAPADDALAEDTLGEDLMADDAAGETLAEAGLDEEPLADEEPELVPDEPLDEEFTEEPAPPADTSVATADTALPPPPQPGLLDRFVPAGLRDLVPGGALTIVGVAVALLAALGALVFKLVRREKAEIISEEELLHGLAEEPDVTDADDQLDTITHIDEEEETRTQIDVEGDVEEAPDSELETLQDFEPEATSEDTVTLAQTLGDEFTATMPAAEDQTEIEVAAVDEAEEEDPLAEVNVYLAYERFDQAEELVKKAIADHPEEHKYKLRLLEVYYSANNVSAFEQAARDLHAAVDGSGPLWESAETMWREMSPDRAMFEGGAAAAEAQPAEASLSDEDSMSQTMAIPPGQAQRATFQGSTPEIDLELDASTEGGKMDLDFDLDDTGEHEMPAAADASEAATFQSELEELDSASLDATAEKLLGGTADGEGEQKIVDLSSDGDLEELFDATVDPEDKYADEIDKLGSSSNVDLLDTSSNLDTSVIEQEDILDITGTGKQTDAASDEDALFDLTSSLAKIEASLSSTAGSAEDVEFDISGSEDITERNDEETPVEEAPDFLDITGEHSVVDSASADNREVAEEESKKESEFDIGSLDLDLESSLQASKSPIEEALEASAAPSNDSDLEASLSIAGEDSMDLSASGLSTDETGSSELDLMLDLEDSTDRMEVSSAGGETVELPDGQVARHEGTADESLDDLAKALEETVSGLKAESTADDDISLDLEIEPETPSRDGAAEQAETLALDEVSSGPPSESTVKMPAEELADEQTLADEVDTKLNLAKAYIELGDADGAKAILAEVSAEGSDDQKQQAAELMKELA